MPDEPQTGASRRWLRSIAIGLLATGVVVALALAGGMTRLEQITFDQRSRWFSRFTPPPSTHVVHIHIDDNALSTIGRWPWPRAYLADVVDELNRAGAQVIAFDLLFKSPQPDRIVADGQGFRTVQDDRLLAHAIAGSRHSVVAMDLAAVPIRSEIEQRAVAKLKQDLDVSGDELARLLNAEPVERRRITGEFSRLRAAAARDRVRELFAAGDAPTLDDACGALLPGLDEFPPEHPAVRIIAREYDQVASLYRVMPRLPLADRPNQPIRTDMPIRLLTAAASSAGVVSFEYDTDGVVRSTPLWVTTEGRRFPHFALATACELLDVPLNRLRVTDDETIIPDAKLPSGEVTDIHIPMISARPGDGWAGYRRDRVFITWPTNAANWRMVYDPDKEKVVQQVPIGTIVELKRMRAQLDLNEKKIEFAYSKILTDEAMAGLVPEELFTEYKAIQDELIADKADADRRGALLARRAELRKQVLATCDFVLDDFKPLIDSGEKLSDEEAALYQLLTTYVKRIRTGERIADQRAELDRMASRIRSEVEGKACVIGWSATGSIADFIPTALFDRTPGPVGHGALINAILTDHFLRRAPVWLDVGMIVLLGGAVTLIAARFPPISALAISTGLGLAYYLFNGIAVFDYASVVLAAASPCTAGVLAWVGVTVYRLVMEQREKARITKQFKNYVSGDLVDLLVANPAMIKQGRHELTCMFCDIAGFTTVTEALGPEQIIALLNRYLGVMTQRIMDGRGTVNKYMGDCIMAFWGAPIDDDQHTLHACQSVMDCFAALRELEKDEFFQNVPKLSIRFGVATGPMMVGDCGAPPDRSDYTVIGDVVNLSSRLEGANKAFGTKALVNDRTAELVRERMLLRPIGRVRVVGKVEPVAVYELMNTADAATDDDRKLAEMTTEMVDAFQAGDFAACIAACEALTDAFGESKLAALYAASARAYTETAPPDDFAGELVLSEK